MSDAESAPTPPAAAEDLLPCPFCGGPAGFEVGDPNMVICVTAECQATGPWAHSRAHAIATWNERSDEAPAAPTPQADARRWHAFRFTDAKKPWWELIWPERPSGIADRLRSLPWVEVIDLVPASEVDRLAARVKELEGALRPFARVEDLRRARAALQQEEEGR